MITRIIFISFLSFVMPISIAFADTSSGEKRVSSNIEASCIVQATGISFGDITGTGVAVSPGEISLMCTKDSSYEIRLNFGVNTTVESRFLANQFGNKINYVVCKNDVVANTPSRCDIGQVWYTGAKVNYAVTGIGNGFIQKYPTYGMVSRSYSRPGNYSDTMTATIVY